MGAWILVGLLAILTLTGIAIEARHNKLKHEAQLALREHKFGKNHL
jgi:hypothetical protein